MNKFFISGVVTDDQLASGAGEVSLRASLTGTKAEKKIVWEGVTAANGTFHFEFRLPEKRSEGALLIEAVRDDNTLASQTLQLDSIEDRSAHVLLTISSKPAKAKASNLMASFPIGVPGHDRPPAYQGTPKLEIDPPTEVPKHPMAALPFLIAASRQRDPFEEEGRSKEKGRRSIKRETKPGSPPPASTPP